MALWWFRNAHVIVVITVISVIWITVYIMLWRTRERVYCVCRLHPASFDQSYGECDGEVWRDGEESDWAVDTVALRWGWTCGRVGWVPATAVTETVQSGIRIAFQIWSKQRKVIAIRCLRTNIDLMILCGGLDGGVKCHVLYCKCVWGAGAHASCFCSQLGACWCTWNSLFTKKNFFCIFVHLNLS